MKEEQNIYAPLGRVQQALKAPKDLNNSFGGYKYRSAESILEAVKPLLAENGLVITISDTMINNGDRHYVEATVTVYDLFNNSISTTALAREAEAKKGMDEAQITGAASSYARKYALNGMFAIDDTKDPDTDEHTAQRNKAAAPKVIRNRTEEIAAGPEPFDGSILDKAKSDLKQELIKQGYKEADDMKGFIKFAIGKETIETIEEAREVAEALDNQE